MTRFRQLDVHDTSRLLKRAAFPCKSIEGLAGGGVVHEFMGLPVIISQRVEPLLRVREVYISYVHPSLLTSEKKAIQLWELIRDEWPSTRVLIRTPPGTPLVSNYGHLIASYVERIPQTHESSASLHVKPLETAEDVAFVLRLIAHGLLGGYKAQGFKVTYTNALRYAKATLANLGRDPTTVSVIGVIGGHRIGHATCISDVDPLTGSPVFELLDTFVLKEFRGRGLARSLMSYLESTIARRANSRGVPLRGSVVVRSDSADVRVFENLLVDSWEHYCDLWVANKAYGAQ